VSYEISLSCPHLPSFVNDQVLWFQHAFGMWGRESPSFVRLINEAKSNKKKVIATFHTIHFESDETDSGMQKKEEILLKAVLPLLDAATVFTDGAYRAVTRAYPEYEDKVVVLRHGIPLYPWVSQEEAKEKLFGYLISRADLSLVQKQEISEAHRHLLRKEAILLGNLGFITSDKDPVRLYKLGQMVQHRLTSHLVFVVYIGRIQMRKDKKMRHYLPVLEKLRSVHDGKKNLFFEDYVPEDVFPLAFRALDFPVFWCQNATQSGRMAHALGSGSCVVGRRIEGIGETLDLAGLPSAISLEDLAEKIVILVIEPGKREEANRLGRRYARRFSFENQAQKHLLLEEAVWSAKELPSLDRTKAKVTFILDNLALAGKDGLDDPPKEITAFLNVADDAELHPRLIKYHKIPLRDGVPIPVEAMKEGINWIEKNIESGRVLVFCRYGRGRSASVITGYLCSIGFDYERAVRLIMSKKPDTYLLPRLAQTIRMALQE